MAQFIKNYVQDLTQDIQIRHCGTLIFNTDEDSNVINVALYNGQEEAPQSGSVACAVICSDGSTVPVTGGTISGNTVSVTLGADGLIPGQVGIGIQVISGGVKTTVFKGIYSVELFETDTVVDPSSRITISVGELVQDIEDAVASIPADYSDLLAAIAPDYTDLTFPVAAGTWCWYSGSLYQAKVDIPSSESWTAAHWETASLSNALAGDVAALKSAISDITGNQKIQMTSGGYYSLNGESVTIGTPSASLNWKYAVIPCTENDKFTINGAGTAEKQPWAFVKSNGDIISRANNSADVSVTNLLIVAPAGSAYLVLNNKIDNEGISFCNELLSSIAETNSSKIETIESLCVSGFFNLFNKFSLVKNMSLKDTGPSLYSASSSYVIIPVDRNRDPSLGRMRSSQICAKLLTFNADMEFLAIQKNRYAVELSSNCYYVGFVYANESTNFDTLMIAYTDETDGATSDKWNTLFPGIGYVPYRTTDYEKVYSATLKKYLPDIIHEYVRDSIGGIDRDTVMDALADGGATISTDTYTGERVATLAGTSASKTHASISVPCEPCRCYNLEFKGYASDDSWDYATPKNTLGAILTIEFLDADGVVIGSRTGSGSDGKYNGFVCGTQNRKYHRYQYVSPYGAKTLRLRITTRANTNATISSVSVTKTDVYPKRLRNGILIDGHLGMNRVAPKNTMPGFELANIAGHNCVICNVHFTSDNVPVVIHDATIDATSNGTGNVEDFTYSELLEYDFGAWFDPAYTGTKIPKLDDVAGFLASCGIKLAISLHGDLTNAQLDSVCAIIVKYYNTQVLIKSFYLTDLQYIQPILGDLAEYMFCKSSMNTTTLSQVAALGFPATYELSATNVDNTTELDNFVVAANTAGVKLSAYNAYDILLIHDLIKHGIKRFTTDCCADFEFPIT